jgi:competence protein ComEA
MQDARTRFALLIVCLLCLLGSGFVLLTGRRAAPPPVTISPPPAQAATSAPPTMPPAETPHAVPANRLYVDVAGAVRRPSLYVLPPQSRVMQAILAAGGPTQEADMDAVNLAQKVTDGEKVFVPKRSVTPPTGAAGDALPTPVSSVPSRAASEHAKGGRSSHADKITATSGEQIALNMATEADLQRLPGVGPSMAGRILAFRQQAGRFEKIEDLMQVTGIGPKKFAKIAPFVKLD